MRRTGSSVGAALLGVCLWALPVAAGAAELEFYQSVDRTEVGTEDTLRLTVVRVNAPEDSELELPDLDAFEVLGRSPVSQTSISVTGAGTQIQRINKLVLVLRARRPGKLRIGPSTLDAGGQTYRTDPVEVVVRQGSVGGGGRAQRPPRPFGNFPFPNLPGMPNLPDLEDEDPFAQLDIPTSDSDLFVRTYLDKEEAYVGEQVTLSVFVLSRVDFSSVDSINLPKLDGFWAEDLDSPSQLTGETKLIRGVPYRAFLLRRKAIFPTRAGKVEIDPAEVDVTTGYLFAGHRVHRVGNRARLEVKPLPPNPPAGFSATNVGTWRLSVQAEPLAVRLGEPVTVKVTLQGRGNVKNVTPPPLEAPAGMRVYDPQITDELTPQGARLAGRRTHEYLVMPSQTGTFTLPPLEFPYFDPATGRYEIARSEAVPLTVEPGGAGPVGARPPAAGGTPAEEGARNVLAADGIRPLPYAPVVRPPSEPVWRRGYFVAGLLGPVGLLAAGGLAFAWRTRSSRSDPRAAQLKQTREARRRLSGAERLQAGPAPEFYAEVERALLAFIAAQLGAPVVGLTRPALDAQLSLRGIPAEVRAKVTAVLEAAELGRFAPGADEPGARSRVLDDAARVMAGWDRR